MTLETSCAMASLRKEIMSQHFVLTIYSNKYHNTQFIKKFKSSLLQFMYIKISAILMQSITSTTKPFRHFCHLVQLWVDDLVCLSKNSH